MDRHYFLSAAKISRPGMTMKRVEVTVR